MKFILKSVKIQSVPRYKNLDSNYIDTDIISQTFEILIPRFSSTLEIQCFEGEKLLNKISSMFNIHISDIELEDFTDN
jgi:hypothetical protein